MERPNAEELSLAEQCVDQHYNLDRYPTISEITVAVAQLLAAYRVKLVVDARREGAREMRERAAKAAERYVRLPEYDRSSDRYLPIGESIRALPDEPSKESR